MLDGGAGDAEGVEKVGGEEAEPPGEGEGRWERGIKGGGENREKGRREGERAGRRRQWG